VQPPHEPVTGSVPQTPAPRTPAPGTPEPGPEQPATAEAREKPKPKRRNVRLWVAVAAGVVVLLVVGSLAVAFLFYDKETKIERTAPDAVVDNFLGAYLVNRSDDEAALYQCNSGGDFSEIEAFRTDIVTREQDHSVGITVSWGSFEVTTNGDRGSVVTDLTKATSNGRERITKPWQFIVVDQDGWRVCGASQIGQ
jgi:flagellar basal body-associated protein FliL